MHRTISITIALACGFMPLTAQTAPPVHSKASGCATGFALASPIEVQKEFNPSGWMGDGEKGKQYVQMTPVAGEKPRPGDENGQVIKIHYQPGGVAEAVAAGKVD